MENYKNEIKSIIENVLNKTRDLTFEYLDTHEPTENTGHQLFREPFIILREAFILELERTQNIAKGVVKDFWNNRKVGNNNGTNS